jgi:hypothetical protein
MACERARRRARSKSRMPFTDLLHEASQHRPLVGTTAYIRCAARADGRGAARTRHKLGKYVFRYGKPACSVARSCRHLGTYRSWMCDSTVPVRHIDPASRSAPTCRTARTADWRVVWAIGVLIGTGMITVGIYTQNVTIRIFGVCVQLAGLLVGY